MSEQIKKIINVYYPLEEAIQKAAEQNFKRDVRNGIVPNCMFVELGEEQFKGYLTEVRELFKINGMNYIPEHPDHERICDERVKPD